VVERRDDGDVPSEDSSSEHGALLRRYPRHPRLAVTAFVDDMAVAYGAADLAFARAGAVTCAELLATATPAVLVPSPNVAEDHQSVNAEAMEFAGAATAMSEARMVADGDGATVEEVVGRLLSDDDGTLERMRRAAREADRPGAAEAIARDVARVALKTP
jgi:UDP-N-acetylglucosamine--N-acetylmuramyl-(pentapeptide) pyrophosphoryl-undecaprenol N-acetylglucosamine transferase